MEDFLESDPEVGVKIIISPKAEGETLLLYPQNSRCALCLKTLERVNSMYSKRSKFIEQRSHIADYTRSNEFDGWGEQRVDGLPLLQLPPPHLNRPGPIPQPYPGELPHDYLPSSAKTGEAQHCGRG